MANFDLQRYRDFKPTQFDHHIELDDREDWLVLPVSRNRDSEALAESNFEACLKNLGGEQNDLVEVHRFGHWGNGWFEIILAHPDLEDQCAEIEAALADYPVLDDADLSRREWEELEEYWDWNGRSEFASLLKQRFTLSDELVDWVSYNLELSDFQREIFPQVPGLYPEIYHAEDFCYQCEHFINNSLFTRQICGQWLRQVRRRVEREKVQQLELLTC